MKKICAWYRREQQVDAQSDFKNIITHGICENCKDNLLFQLGVDLRVFLDSLNVPIIVVNRKGTISTANNQAIPLLRKGLPEIEGHKGGGVFECAYARLPERCGNTIHCSGCTIRRTVMQKHETGKSFLEISAILNRDNPENPEKN